MLTPSSTRSSRFTMYALVANGLTSLSAAVSLSNFTPRIENLPSTCQQVYTREIANCQASDFPSPQQPNNRCSQGCVNGLIDIGRQVQAGCGSVDVPETSIIGVFLLGQGIPSLCPGLEVTTITPSQASTQAPQTSQQPPPQPQPSSADDDDGDEPSTTEAASSTLETSAVSSVTSSGGIVIDTSVPTNAQSPPQNTQQPSDPAQPSQTASSQKSNADSGGGSPFDVQATAAAPGLRTSKALAVSVVLGAVALVFSAL